MPPELTGDAWLENADGERIAIVGSCSLGRSSDSTIRILSDKASRRHAMIHSQPGEGYLLIDFGSSNGTYLNGHRVTRPVRLNHGDRVAIAQAGFVFNQPASPGGSTPLTGEATMLDFCEAPCWMVIADLADFTGLSQQVPKDQLAVTVGGWIRECKTLVEAHGGAINKYLGDGFMAYWRADRAVPGKVAAAVDAIGALRAQRSIAFRVVVHHGTVGIGGSAVLGDEAMIGHEVNFAFRMEKLAGSLGIALLLSDAANVLLCSDIATEEVAGMHELKGFSGRHRFHRAT